MRDGGVLLPALLWRGGLDPSRGHALCEGREPLTNDDKKTKTQLLDAVTSLRIYEWRYPMEKVFALVFLVVTTTLVVSTLFSYVKIAQFMSTERFC